MMLAIVSGKTQSLIITQEVGTDIFQEAQQVLKRPLPGLVYHYYEGAFEQTKDIKIAAAIESGIVSHFSLENSKSENYFALTFDGYIQIPTDGLYTFYLESNDGSMLNLDDDQLIDNDGAHGTYEKTGSISLRKGFHKISISYFQQSGGKHLRVYWEGADFQKEEILGNVLFH